MSPEDLFVLRKLVAALVLPPIGPVVLFLLAALLATRWGRLGKYLFLATALFSVAIAMPVVADWLQWSFELRHPYTGNFKPQSDEAIVILGGGRTFGALEYGGETIAAATLERVRYGAHLARQTGLPVLVSGGKPGGGRFAEADMMADVLKTDYGVATRWIENESVDTVDNANRSIAMLSKDGIHRILLVTDVVHMQRAVLIFEERGMLVTAAPTGYQFSHTIDGWSFMPDALSYARSSYTLHEWLGITWMRATHG